MVGPYIASLLETTGFEILITDGNNETVLDSLPENEVIAFQLSDNESRSPFSMAQVGEGNHDHIARRKSPPLLREI